MKFPFSNTNHIQIHGFFESNRLCLRRRSRETWRGGQADRDANCEWQDALMKEARAHQQLGTGDGWFAHATPSNDSFLFHIGYKNVNWIIQLINYAMLVKFQMSTGRFGLLFRTSSDAEITIFICLY